MDLLSADVSSPSSPQGLGSETSSLGLHWDTEEDALRIKVTIRSRSKTKRGLLSYIMSPYDPFGEVAPALRQTKFFQRQVFPTKCKVPLDLKELRWDYKLPERFDKPWEELTTTLNRLTISQCRGPMFLMASVRLSRTNFSRLRML